jgi:inorganic pyrophosphatase
VYKNLEEKETAVEEVANADTAVKIIEEAITRYNEVFFK